MRSGKLQCNTKQSCVIFFAKRSCSGLFKLLLFLARLHALAWSRDRDKISKEFVSIKRELVLATANID